MSFFASFLGPGVASWYLFGRYLGLSTLSTFSLTTMSVVGGLLGWLRVQIQDGFVLDRAYRKYVDMTGRVVLVTGATPGGLGHEAAKMFANMGATIVVTVRSDSKGAAATAELGPKASYVVVDFTSAKAIKAGAKAFLAKQQRLDVLVLNAGVGGVAEPPDTWMANHIGPSIFTRELLPTLETTAKAHSDVRIVCVSSSSHKDAYIDYDKPYDRVKEKPDDEVAYRQSKLAQIMWMRALQGKLRAKPGLSGESAIRCLAISPGVAFTNIMAAIPALFQPLCWILFRTPYMGAQVIKMAAIDPSVPGGSFLTNCTVVPSGGKDGCSNEPAEWEKVWQLTEKCMADGKYP